MEHDDIDLMQEISVITTDPPGGWQEAPGPLFNHSPVGCASFTIMPSNYLHFHKLPLITFYFLGHFCVGKVRFVVYIMKNVHSTALPTP
jgi:hypothetical protein